MKNKKAAIELSVTAIVILILAIVMLGLGLGFIRGMFGKVQTQFEEQIAAEPEPPEASGSEPITLSRETIVTHAKDAEVLKISFYNPSNQVASISGTTTLLLCDPGVVANPKVNAKTIGKGESGRFNYLFSIGDTATTGTNLCKISITAGSVPNDVTYTKDLIIKVTK